MPAVLEIARGYVAGGLSVVPIQPNGTKAPTVSWKVYQKRQPTPEELSAWFASSSYGLAIICGGVSGNLEVLDFDEIGAFESWWLVMQADCPSVLGKLPVVATPGNGRHVYYRLPFLPEGNRKLAWGGAKASVETRGEGGYVLAPGCPPACHPSGGIYLHVSGPPLTHIPVLGAEE